MLAKDGSVKITDFGLARNLKAASKFTTVSGAFMGTPGFIAPSRWTVRGWTPGRTCIRSAWSTT